MNPPRVDWGRSSRTEASYDYVDTRHAVTVEGEHRTLIGIPLYDGPEHSYGGLAIRVVCRRPRQLLYSFMHPIERTWTAEAIRADLEKIIKMVDENALTEGVDLDAELIRNYR